MNRILILIFSLLIILIVGCQKNEHEDSVLPKIEQPGGYFYIGKPNVDQQKLIDTIVASDIKFEEPITFVFDKNGNLIQIINKNNYIYSISIENNIIKGLAEFDNLKWIFEFDNNFNLLSNYNIDINTGGKHGFLYEYDGKNRLIRKEVLSHNSEMFDLYIYKYDEKGNYNVTAYNNGLFNPEYFKYNSSGNLIWHCWVNTKNDDNPSNDEYKLIWYNNAKNIIREERRHFADSAIFWFATYEFLDNGLKKDWTYWVEKDFALNTENPSIYRYKGDSILSSFNEYNASGVKIKSLFSTTMGNAENDVTHYTFIQIMREYNNTGLETNEIHYQGDFRFNSIEYRFGDYIYNETNNTLTQRMQFDSNNKSIYRYTYEYVFDTTSSKYNCVRENCIDTGSGQLIWYIDGNGIKRNPDGSVYSG